MNADAAKPKKVSYKRLLVLSAKNWNRDNASRLAAGLSFFAVLSLAPLLVFAVVAIGQIYGNEGFAREKLLHIARENIGPGSVDFLKELLKNAHQQSLSTLAGGLSLVVALFGASNLFEQLSAALDVIWGVPPSDGHIVKNFILSKAVSVIMVLAFALFVVAWLVLDSIVGAAARNAGAFPGWPFISLIISTAFLTGVFGLTFKALPHGLVSWRDVVIPSIVTALGFSIAKFVLSLYFTYTHIESAYGPAGALVLILLWIYYSAQIFFFGAEMASVFAHTYGSQQGRTLPETRFS
jgi:membrane protein